MKTGVEEKVRVLGAEVAEKEAHANGVERELRVEREWRTFLQESSITSVEKISQLHQEVDQLKQVAEVIKWVITYFNTFPFNGKEFRNYIFFYLERIFYHETKNRLQLYDYNRKCCKK